MSKPDSPTVEEIFQQAIERPSPEERRAFLDSACAHDARLRDRIDALLRAHDAAAGFFDAARFADQTTLPPRPAEGPGTVIDKYKLLQSIGEGGFGAVYMAEQKEPVQRKVALKIIKLGMDTKQVIARFEAERQALAMMDHPNIARVLDAGATETGRPYFVMELVKGVPITEYCDTENLSTKERLDLFIKVCNAVQHAHQKGIIHRDLKPSNVMVTLHDGKPVPKVIDFGIAKAMNRSLTEKTLFTEYRQFIGTPEYMSPEQAEMSGLDIDTRSDIYSLGVLLYMLLTGVTPFDSARLRSAAINEIQRIIREEEPSRPSTRLSELSRNLPSPRGRGAGGEGGLEPTADHSSIHYIAKHRRTDPGSLARQLRGDLDWIVMRALEKDRARRYETANGFATDIERYLSDEPVTATPPSATYRLKKLIRRNKGAFTAAAALFIVLTLGVIGTTWGLISARAEADRAERALTRASEVKQVISDMFDAIGPDEAKGQDITLLKRILDDTAARLSRGEIKDELVAAKLHSVIGDVYRHLGLYDAAERHLPIALEIAERRLSEQNPWTLQAIGALADLYHDQARYPEAERLKVRHLKLAKAQYGEEHRSTLGSMNNLANLYNEQGRYTEAEQLLRKTLALMQRVLGEEHPHTLRCMTNLAWAIHSQQRQLEAQPLYLRTLEIKRRVLGEEHTDALNCMNNLASSYFDVKEYEEAGRLFDEVVAVRERVQGDEHPSTLSARINVAIVHIALDRLDEARELLQPTLEKLNRVVGDKHPDTAICLTQLANVYEEQGDFEAAEPLYRRALEIRREKLGDEHDSTLGAITNLARTCNSMRRYGDARQLLEESVPAKQRVLGLKHPWTRHAMRQLSIAYMNLERPDLAAPILRALVDSTPQGPPDVTSLNESNDLGLTYRNMGRNDEAEPLLKRAMEGKIALLGMRNRDTLASITNLGLLYNDMGRHDEARALLETSVPVKRDMLGITHSFTRNAIDGLATAYLHLDRREEALPLFRELLEYWLAAANAPDADVGILLRAAQNLLLNDIEELRDRARALSFAERALKLEESGSADRLWVCLDTLALAQHRNGDTLGAIDSRRRALDVIPPQHPYRPTLAGNLGGLYRSAGLRDEAVEMYRVSLEPVFTEAEKPGADPGTLDQAALILLQYEIEEIRDPERAIAFARRACEVEEAAGGDRLWIYLDRLAIAQHTNGGTAEAIATLTRAATLIPPDHPYRISMARRLGEFHLALGQRDHALSAYRDAVALELAAADKADATASICNEAAWSLLGHPFEELKEPIRALPLARRACALEEASGGRELYNYLDTLALALHINGDTAAAIETQKRAISLMPPDTEETAREGLEARLREFETALAAAHPAQNEQQR